MKNKLIYRLIVIVCMCIGISSARAQYAAIPDSNFGIWLARYYPGCVIGNGTVGYSLDTTCARVVSDFQVNCSNSNIHDLTGIKYFKSLTALYCENNYLTSLPYFDSLDYFVCDHNLLPALPALSPTLGALLCSNNPLISLPALPSRLNTLICDSTNITSLPTLPNNLSNIYCSHNPLVGLPTLPSGIQVLKCEFDQLTSLPALPSALGALYCDGNSLDSLPSLPASLYTLNCDSNNLTQLPLLPSGISNLYCSHNRLTRLDPGSYNLSILNCAYNLLDSLPSHFNVNGSIDCSYNRCVTLPDWFNNAGVINCSHNQLTSLPNLYGGLSLLDVLDCSYNQLTSLMPNLASFIYLSKLRCNNNRLTTIPPFSNIVELHCSYNMLTSLPSLPNFSNFNLYCDSNYLSVIPAFSGSVLDCRNNCNLSCIQSITQSSVSGFFISGTGITCLPSSISYVDSFDINPTSLPTCTGQCSAVNNYVQIPDTNFGTWLSAHGYSTCLIGNNTSGWQLDTACSKVLAADSMDCHSSTISDLTGIQYFKNLSFIDCSKNLLVHMPPLSSALSYLTCDSNSLVDLPMLPAGLSRLYCSYNRLISIPTMPVGLALLYCSHDSLTSLPAMSVGLEALNCSDNQLTSLPALPANLISIDCHNNANLNCLPYIYQSELLSFYIANTGISCLPNRFSVAPYGFNDANPDTLRVCSFSTGCIFYDNISGNIHNDTATTCASDSLHPGSMIYNVNVLLKQNGQVVQQCYASSTGGYSFLTDSIGTYTVEIDTSGGLPFSVVCPGPDSIDVSLSRSDTIAPKINFGLHCSGPDYGVAVLWGSKFKPGDTTTAYVIAGNSLLYFFNASCGAGVSGTVMTTIHGPVHYAGPSAGALTPSYVSGDTLLYNISNLDSLTIGSLYIRVYTDTSASIGTTVCMSSVITPSSPDRYPFDDTLTECFAVVSSFDPNHKTVSPAYVSRNSDWLTYTVEFQNTGTAPASTVVVRDTLSQMLLPQTFKYVASSHNAQVRLVGNAITFTFSNINLPDSASDPIGSKGWLQYKVRTQPNLPLTTQIRNTAFIYFDYNPAIVTNTIVSTVGSPNGIASIEGKNIKLYPNPNKGVFTLLATGSKGRQYTISDMLGHIVAQQVISADSQDINLSHLAEGVYTLSVYGEQPVRFVVVK